MLEVTSAQSCRSIRLVGWVEESIERNDEKGREVGDEADDHESAVENEDGDWLELIGRVSVRNGRILDALIGVLATVQARFTFCPKLPRA
jgi:hypothetical protein